MHIALKAAGPDEKAQQLPTVGPDKAPEVASGDGLGLHSGKRLDAPAQVLAAPWREPVAAGCIPQKSERCEHFTRLPGASLPALSIDAVHLELCMTEVLGRVLVCPVLKGHGFSQAANQP